MRQKEDISLRLATLEDVDRIVELHFLCFDTREHLATVLGRRFIRDMYRWFVASGDTFTVCACLGDQILGFSAICRGPYHKLLFRENRLSAIRAFICRPWLVLHPQILRRALRSRSGSNEAEAFLEKEKDAAIYALMAIRSDYRGTGLNRRLNDEVNRECRNRGWRKLLAIAYRKNLASRRSSEKSGYKEIALSADSDEKIVYLLDLGADQGE